MPRSTHFVITALASLGAGAWSAPESQNTDDSPIPFKVTIKFGPGGGRWIPWEATLTNDGRVVQESYDFETQERVVRRFVLSDRSISRIRARIKSGDFMHLREDYDGPFEDGASFVIGVTMGKSTHKVAFANPNDLQENQDVTERIVPLLVEILRSVPSPNPDQTAGFYQGED